MRRVVVVLAAIPLAFVMAVTVVPTTVFWLCDGAMRRLVEWRDKR